MLKENHAQEARKNLAKVLRANCRVLSFKKNEFVISCQGQKYRVSVFPGLQEGTYSLSTGIAGEDSDGFFQRDVSYTDLVNLLSSPMIWSWTYKSFNHRFSQVLNGLIRLSYDKRETWPVLKPLIQKALEDLE